MSARRYIAGIVVAISLDAAAVVVDQYGAPKLAVALSAAAAILSATAILFLLRSGETR